MRVLVLSLLGAIVAAVAAGVALQLASGGVHYRSLSPSVLAVALAVLGSIVVVHRPGQRLGPLLFANGLAFGAGTLAAGALDYGAAHGMASPLAQAAFAVVQLTAVMNAAWALFILWFPDGRFPSAGWRTFFVVGTALTVLLVLAGWLVGPADHVNGFYAGTSVPDGAHGPFAQDSGPLAHFADITLLFPVVALGAMIQRRRSAGPVVREQVRWLLVAIGVDVVAQVATAPFVTHHGPVGVAASAVAVATTPLPVLAAGAAILRYRLWDIDIVVSRALVYGVLWAVLSALLLVPGLTAGLLVGGRGALAAVAMALVVTLAFHPVRTRLERVAERVVYRHRARPYALLTGFWETLRTQELERLGPLLAEAVRSGLGVEWAGAWLYARSDGRGTLRPLGVAGVDAGRPLTIDERAAERLLASPCLVLPGAPPEPLPSLWVGRPAAVVPLVAAEELVGLIACGERRADPLGPRDFELLELLGRDCALRLRNLRLEAELRARLEQIEAQAEALLHSRRRLVTAQDEERRRIERNLHDGIQQQLVALAVRLHQAGTDRDPLLADLASEAEQAVFALQDLARGIFPSVLVDQGLVAALRTQAGRMPLAVRVEADTELIRARLDPELETALYFVALEALTNVQKHAPDSAAAVWLRLEAGNVVLEVADDGPGFERRPGAGAGLQNMADRIAAAGGTFSLETAPGAGTRVRATAPAPDSAGARLAQVDQNGRHAPVELPLGREP